MFQYAGGAGRDRDSLSGVGGDDEGRKKTEDGGEYGERGVEFGNSSTGESGVLVAVVGGVDEEGVRGQVCGGGALL